MPDREKVNGFELCANGEPCIGEKFTSCPFSPRNNAEQNCGVTMARVALALLKGQEAVEPKVEKAILDYQSWHYICGDCGGQIDIHDNYCRHCGRVVAHISNKI